MISGMKMRRKLRSKGGIPRWQVAIIVVVLVISLELFFRWLKS